MAITLKQLQVFVAVAQTGNVTQAAGHIALSQPATSQALAELEDQINLKLFDRIGKKLVLNDDGRKLYPKALALLDGARDFEQRDETVNLRIGASTTIGNYVLPGLIGNFIARSPGSHLELSVGNTRDVIEAIHNFQVDFGFVEGQCLDPAIETAIWRQDELVVFSAPDHPLAQKQNLTATDLASARWVLRERGSGTREVLEHLLGQHVTLAQPVLDLGNSEAIKRVVTSGVGISCLSREVVGEALRSKRLVELPTPFLTLTRPLFVLRHRQKYMSDGMRRFLRWCGADGSVTQTSGEAAHQS